MPKIPTIVTGLIQTVQHLCRACRGYHFHPKLITTTQRRLSQDKNLDPNVSELDDEARIMGNSLGDPRAIL